MVLSSLWANPGQEKMLRTHELFRLSYLDLNKDNFVTGAILRGTSSAFLCTSLD